MAHLRHAEIPGRRIKPVCTIAVTMPAPSPTEPPGNSQNPFPFKSLFCDSGILNRKCEARKAR